MKKIKSSSTKIYGKPLPSLFYARMDLETLSIRYTNFFLIHIFNKMQMFIIIHYVITEVESLEIL